MWDIGFLSEVESLIEKYDLDENLPSMRSVGYRQALEFLLKSDMSHKKSRRWRIKPYLQHDNLPNVNIRGYVLCKKYTILKLT